MPNGTKYSIPLKLIAENRASYYKDEKASEIIEYFKQHHYDAQDWARNNMNWSDVESTAVIHGIVSCDFEDGWCNGNVSIEDD